MKTLVKRLGFFICPIGVLIITLLSSKNCTKLSNMVVAIIVARGEYMWNFKDSGAFLKKYDDNNNLIHEEHISGIFEAWYEYDDKNRKIHYKDSDGEENWYEYYDNGKLKSFWYKARNSEVIYQYDYDENGVLKSLHQAERNAISYN